MSDLGSMRIENESSEPRLIEASQPSLVAPIIPVRPNSTIPVLMGLLLVLGGILLLFMGYSEISRQGEPNLPEYEERQLEQGFATSNVTGDDIQDLHDELRHAKYYWYLGSGFMFGGLLMLVGGVQLLRRRSIGAKLGVGGNAIVIIAALISYGISSGPTNELGPVVSITYTGLAFVYGICSLCCGIFAAFPLLHASGRAALDSHLQIPQEWGGHLGLITNQAEEE